MMHKQIAIIFLLHLTLLSNAQYSYNFLFETPSDERAEFVYHDKLNDEQIVIVIVKCYWYETNCTSKCDIYSITNSGDTIPWTFVDNRNDTLFSINNIYQESNGDYFMTGVGWTLDSIGQQVDVFDYNAKWSIEKEIIWESIHQRPEQFNGHTDSQNFKILKLINGNYLVGKSIVSGSPMFPTYYFTEVNFSTGDIVKEKVSFRGGYRYLQGLTYSIDSSMILLHSGRSWMNECQRNEVGVFMLDTVTYDTVSSYCYNRDDDDPQKYWCVHEPFNAKIRKDGYLILGGTGFCTHYGEIVHEYYYFIYQYDTAFNLINRTFLTDMDTNLYAGWYESMDINDNNEICVAGAFNKGLGDWTSQYCWIYLAKVDENLNLISERYLGGDAAYEVYSMSATPDGGMVVAGTRYDYLVNDFERDAFVIKTDGGLWVGQNEHSVIPVHSVLVYPNPGNALINIRTTEYPSLFELYDTQGKLLFSKQIEKHITPISATSLLPGFYTWTLRKNNMVIDSGKWIKL